MIQAQPKEFISVKTVLVAMALAFAFCAVMNSILP
jgi:hypothetical protein